LISGLYIRIVAARLCIDLSHQNGIGISVTPSLEAKLCLI
jgi:hypothetical protein